MLLLLLSLAIASLPSALVGIGAQRVANEQIFHQQLSSALDAVRSLLESSKSPRRILDPLDVDHQYSDKFTLAEFLVNVAVAASVNALDRLGIDEGMMLRLRQQAQDEKTIQLRFSANETCSFVERKVVEIADPSRKETYETTATGDPQKVEERTTTTRAVREVIEYHWRFNVAYQMAVLTGSIDSIELLSRTASETIVVTGSERTPCQLQYSPPNIDVDLGWIVEQLHVSADTGAEHLTTSFRINRDASSCLTPRRNEEVERAMNYFASLMIWARGVSQYFQFQLVHRIMPYQSAARSSKNGDVQAQAHNIADLFRSISDDRIFVPVLPLFQEGPNHNDTNLGPDLPAPDIDKLLQEQCTTMDSALSMVTERFQQISDKSIASALEARAILLSKHINSLAVAARNALSYVEDMLRSQLVAAIGKEISARDFDGFIVSYYHKLFREDVVAEPFVYAVRRPKHYPDGSLSIESTIPANEWSKADGFEPILTFSRKIQPAVDGSVLSIQMPINAATKIQLEGDQYLHAWVRHDIAGTDAPAQIVARARQFSSFLLVVANISGSGTIQPKSAIIVQNKDEVFIPLLLEPLPTPKEFKDAIQSLSPEQREFAQAFRAMQLESSVFAVAVIQLKPQLEFILGLPHDALAKETRLTQDLLELFIDYQISPDQLSFDGSKDELVSEKLARVKENVDIFQKMIDENKKKALNEAERQSDMKAGGKKYNRAMESRSVDGVAWGDDELMDDVVMADAMESNMMRTEAAVPPKMKRRSSPPKRMLMSTSAEVDGMATASASASASIDNVDHHLRAERRAEEVTSSKTRATEGLGNTIDFSQMAKVLDAAIDTFDMDNVLRPTKISVTEETSWVKYHQKSLLSPREKTQLSSDDKRRERDSAFDLLDALSRGGAQPIQYSELHVIVAATHRFERSIIDTVIESNINPINSIERSALIVASTLHDLPVTDLLLDAGEQRLASIKAHSPDLLDMGKLQRVDGEQDASGTKIEREEVEPALL